jgi:hypothetical protein
VVNKEKNSEHEDKLIMHQTIYNISILMERKRKEGNDEEILDNVTGSNLGSSVGYPDGSASSSS